MQMTVKARRHREKERRIRGIQKAAKQVFLSKGYFNSTMEEIAETAEVGKGTLYLYFENKDELYISLMIPMLVEFGRSLENLQTKFLSKNYKDSSSLVTDFSKLFIKTYRFDPEAIRIFQVFLASDLFSFLPRKTRDKLDEVGKRNTRLFGEIISKATELGLLPKLTPIQLADVLFGLFLGLNLIEENRLRITGKDHMEDTLKFGYRLISKSSELQKGKAKSSGKKTNHKRSSSRKKPRETNKH